MATYVITGVSRGVGFEFVRQLSQDPSATVIGLVRNKKATDDKVAAEIGRSNIHIIHCDLTNYDSLKKAAEEASTIANGAVDYLIANAAVQSDEHGHMNFGALGNDPALLNKEMRDCFEANVVGNVHLFNLFMPMILKGKAKKVIAITTGMADIEFIAKFDIDIGPAYSVSKAALNAVVAKFSAQYRAEGVLFMGISPGVVGTRSMEDMSQEQMEGNMKLAAKFVNYAPHFKGPITPEESVTKVLSVINNASVDKGDGGSFVSHYGNKQWL